MNSLADINGQMLMNWHIFFNNCEHVVSYLSQGIVAECHILSDICWHICFSNCEHVVSYLSQGIVAECHILSDIC